METQKIEMVIQTSHVNIKLLLTMNEAVENMNRLENTIKEAQQPVVDMIKKVNGNASPEIENIELPVDIRKALTKQHLF